MLILCSALFMAAIATADPINGPKMVGSLSTLAHGVSGDLYAVDESTLMLKNFNYDGAGPDAFFWVGTEGNPKNPIDEAKTAILAHPFKDIHYEYRNEAAPILKAASDETITLTLPPTLKVSDLKWLSVWCRLYSVDFGNLMIPADFEVPEANAEPEPKTEPEPEPKTSAEPEPKTEPEPVKKEELPSPVVINNAVDEPKSEPETEPEPETKPEPGHDHDHHDHDHGHGYGHEDEENPNSLESKSEPEPEPGSAPSLVSGLLSLVTVLFLSSLVH